MGKFSQPFNVTSLELHLCLLCFHAYTSILFWMEVYCFYYTVLLTESFHS